MMIRTIDPKLRKQIDDDLNRIKALESTNAALLEALRGTLTAIDTLCSEGEGAEVSVAVALSVVGAKEKANEAIKQAKESYNGY